MDEKNGNKQACLFFMRIDTVMVCSLADCVDGKKEFLSLEVLYFRLWRPGSEGRRGTGPEGGGVFTALQLR